MGPITLWINRSCQCGHLVMLILVFVFIWIVTYKWAWVFIYISTIILMLKFISLLLQVFIHITLVYTFSKAYKHAWVVAFQMCSFIFNSLFALQTHPTICCYYNCMSCIPNVLKLLVSSKLLFCILSVSSQEHPLNTNVFLFDVAPTCFVECMLFVSNAHIAFLCC